MQNINAALPLSVQSNFLNRDNQGENLDNNLSHGFFTKKGGYSSGIYESLNAGLGSGDDRETVVKNRNAICASIGLNGQNLATPYQTHSTDIFTVTKDNYDTRPKADGIVTNCTDIPIGIVTADCGAILFADNENGIIGAAHAGWRGAFDGVIENTICAMEKLGARRCNIRAVLGPTISQKNYEVGPEFIARFLEQNHDYERFFVNSKKPDHHMFDLHEFIMFRFAQSQVAASDLGICTYEGDDYFSYRRTTHRNEKDYGRQLSVIGLKP